MECRVKKADCVGHTCWTLMVHPFGINRNIQNRKRDIDRRDKEK